MTEDIVKNDVLIGKTRTEIIELLGKDYISNKGDELIYEVGHVPGLFNIDPSYLLIIFENNLVVKVKQSIG